MRALKNLKANILLICVVAGLCFLMIGEAAATSYYVSPTPSGSDENTGSSDSPWATFDKAMNVLHPGDTLIIMDGIYYQSLHIDISGTKENPITIKAENEGQVVIDGRSSINPCVIYKSGQVIAFIDLEGIVFKNAKSAVVQLADVSNINIRRVSGYNALEGEENQIFTVQRGSYILFEDIAAGGIMENGITVLSSSYVTVRRAWVKRQGSGSTLQSKGVHIYGSNNCIVENIVATRGDTISKEMFGIRLWMNDDHRNGHDNTIVGNVVYDVNSNCYETSSSVHNMRNPDFQHNVCINSLSGFSARAGDGLNIKNLTVVNNNDSGYVGGHEYYSDSTDLKDCDFDINVTIKNSVIYSNGEYGIKFISGGFNEKTGCAINYPDLIHAYNNMYSSGNEIYSGITKGTGEIYVVPDYDTSIYGYGAYLVRPSNLTTSGEGGTYLGAEVLYRYEDGKLTNKPLWPWPMEERIKRETSLILGTCFSPTYEDAGGGCKGGLWKTLNGVYAEIQIPVPDDDVVNVTNLIIEKGDIWSYFKGYSAPEFGWNTPAFNDETWLKGPAGIGYGDGDDETVLSDMKDNYMTAYIRKTFVINDKSLITDMDMNIDYDDGFVAYLNGVEVARANMPLGIPSYNTQAISHDAGISENFDLNSYISELRDGVNVLAIEVHNVDIASSDLSLIPELSVASDGQTNVAVGLVPAPPTGIMIMLQ